MNAPLPSGQRLLLDDVSLDDKYALERGRVFMTGIQALVRLPILQRQYDMRAGLKKGGLSLTAFVSNLFDEKYNAEFSPGGFVFKARPRIYGVEAGYRF